MNFSMHGGDLYEYDETVAKKGNKEGDAGLPADLKQKLAQTWIDPPRRERKRNYNEVRIYIRPCEFFSLLLHISNYKNNHQEGLKHLY